jgi:hypothetical protein
MGGQRHAPAALPPRRSLVFIGGGSVNPKANLCGFGKYKIPFVHEISNPQKQSKEILSEYM